MKFGQTIYLDYNATTPVDPRVIESIQPWFFEKPGNAASRSHAMGWMAEEAVEQARAQTAAAIGAKPGEIVFTSGATEAVNLAIKGIGARYARKGRHFVIVATEHQAVLDTCTYLAKHGFEVTVVDVNAEGHIDIEELAAAIREDTVLVSVMMANNETGVIHPVEKIGDLCAERNTLFFCDATQAAGKVPIDVESMGIHLLALSAHKVYGPKGVGALYVRQSAPRVQLTPLFHGGGHEGDMRSGTLNVPAIVGLGCALEITAAERDRENKRLAGMRDRLEAGLREHLEGVYVNGDTENRLPHVTNLRFLHVQGDTLMTRMGSSVAVSSGSACASALAEPSHVLLSMGLSEREARSSIRFSLGRFTEPDEIEEVIRLVVREVEALRDVSPVWEMYKAGMLD